MKAGARLQLKLGQKLKLAPQLRQAISLLQLNRLELKEHIRDVLESNPLLEREDEAESSPDDSPEQGSRVRGRLRFR